jgi:putative mRNA 3-end processing factor
VTEIGQGAFPARWCVAPPSAQGSTWTAPLRRLQRRVRERLDAAARRAPAARVDRGFVSQRPRRLAGLQRAIAATGAERVIVTHGYEAVMVRWLSEQGLEAGAFADRVRRRC